MMLKQNIPAKAIANMKIVGLLGFKFDMKVLILEVELGIFLMFLNLWDLCGLFGSSYLGAYYGRCNSHVERLRSLALGRIWRNE